MISEAEPIDAKVTDTLPIVRDPTPPLTGWQRIIDKMIDKNVGADLLTKVFELQQQAEAEMARRAFVADFAAFKAVAPAAIERTGKVGYDSKKGGAVEYTHTELDVAVQILVPHLSANNLSHSWGIEQDTNGVVSVTCRLEHSAGFSRTVTLRGSPDTSGSKNAIQAVGSAVYYLERYTFLAVLGIAQRHGDNDAANGNGGNRITEAQVKDLEAMLKAKSKPLDGFLRWMFNLDKKTAIDPEKHKLELLTDADYRKACSVTGWKAGGK